MYWKVPISSGINESFGSDHLARDLFIHLLLKTRNSDMVEPEFYCGKPYILKKGQVIFGKKAYSEKLRCSPGAILNALCRLSERQDVHQIILKPSHDYTVVTLIFYDDLIKMTNIMSTNINSECPPNRRAKDTNKNVKNDKEELLKKEKTDLEIMKNSFLILEGIK